MKKTTKMTFTLLSLTTVLLACTISSTPVTTPVVVDETMSSSSETPDRLPFEGMWVSEGDAPAIIVFTEDSMYWVESDQVSADQVGARERLAGIVSYDLENHHIILFTQWIRVNGEMVGFDAPNFNVTYQFDSDTLRIGVGWDEEFAAQTDPIVYYRR